MADWVCVGVGACVSGSGALAVDLLLSGRRTAAVGVPASHIHVSEVEEVPALPGTGVLEAAPYAPYEDDTAEFLYCPAEFRVTGHAVCADGARRCWRCGPVQGDM